MVEKLVKTEFFDPEASFDNSPSSHDEDSEDEDHDDRRRHSTLHEYDKGFGSSSHPADFCDVNVLSSPPNNDNDEDGDALMVITAKA